MRAVHVLPFLLAACDGGEPEPEAPAWADNFGVTESEGDPNCENLEQSTCLFPYPSDRWLDTSGDVPKVAPTLEAMPTTVTGQPFDPVHLAGPDGFGIATPILFQLPGATLAGTEVFDVAASIEDDHPTVIVDLDTGARIPHWVETEWLADGADPVLLTLRPAVPWPRGHRIAVAVRGMVDASGVAVPAPAGFAALRDQEASTIVGLHDRRATFEDVVFPGLADAGVPRDDLQLAWWFTTSTEEPSTRVLLAMRDRMLDALGTAGPDVTIDAVEEPVDDPHIARIIDGTAQIPSFVLPAESDGIRRLRLDEDGLPAIDGFESVPFRLQIPHSALAATERVEVLQYGHGFLGSINEANNRWLKQQAHEQVHLILASDMQGMSSDNEPLWISTLLAGGTRFPLLAEEAMQGVVNHVALQRMVKTSLLDVDDPALERDDGEPVWDGETVWYYGNSQGGSVGTVVSTVSVDIERAVLGVPGCCYPFLLQRSVVFGEYADQLGLIFQDPLDVPRFLALVGTGWDGFEPLTWAPHLVQDPLPDTPAKQVLLHVAQEDAQVHNQASFILGRAVGAKLADGSVRDVFGLESASLPSTEGALLIEYDFGVPADATPLDPPVDATDTHGTLRKLPEAQEQLVHFLRTGELIDVCNGGPCSFPDFEE